MVLQDGEIAKTSDPDQEAVVQLPAVQHHVVTLGKSFEHMLQLPSSIIWY